MAVTAVLLAAGIASRMGSPKQLLDVGGVSMVARSVIQLQASQLTTIRVVTGAEADAVSESLGPVEDPARLEIIYNPEYASGSFSSLTAGLAGVKGPVLVAVADMPFVRPADVDLVVSELESGAWGVVTEYRDAIGHPFGLSTELVADLPETAEHRFLFQHLTDDSRCVNVTVDHVRPLDVNTPADLQSLATEPDQTI